jgi:hypothetical protein
VQATAVGAVPAGPTEESYEQLQQMLLQRGVTWQRLKTGTNKDEWLFLCSIPVPGRPNTTKDYQANAVGPYGLAAIRGVIKQIDESPPGR